MADFLLYWRPSTADAVADGSRKNYLGSDWFAQDGVRPGDVVWGVTSRGTDDLHLVTRVDVDRVLHSRAEAVDLLGEDIWGEAEHFVVGPEGPGVVADIDLSEVARRLTFEGAVERLPAGFTGRNLQRMRRLTPESAALLERAWQEGEAVRPPRFVWQKDELILALDLYLRLNKVLPDDTHPEVIALSGLLRRLPIHQDRHLDPTFRNPNGVALKVANFRRIDQPGRGMSRGNQLEQVVWDEFASDLVRLRRTAELIAGNVETPQAAEPVGSPEEEESFPEGRIAYRLHVARERNRALVRRKKEQALERDGRLVCEVCAFDFKERYGDLGDGFIECHHTVPIHTLQEGAQTRLEDVALVCSNCHRMIHRSRTWLEVGELRGRLQN